MPPNRLLLQCVNALGLWRMVCAFEKFREAKTVIILNYHGVGSSSFLPGLPLSVFQDQLDFLINHCTVISLSQAVEFLLGRGEIPRNAVVLTFDDGTKDSYVHVFPLLQRHNLSATIFLPTLSIGTERMLWIHKRKYIERRFGSDLFWREVYSRLPSDVVPGGHDARSRRDVLYLRLDKKIREHLIEDVWRMVCGDVDEARLARELYLSWDDVREMSRAGIEFGSHTVSHPVLTVESIESIKKEVCASREKIEREVGAPCDLFSYPFGSFDERVIDGVRQAGYSSAFSVIDGRNGHLTERFALRRIRVIDEPLHSFAYRVSPLRFWLGRSGNGRESRASKIGTDS